MRWWILFAGGGLGAVLRFSLALWVDQRAPTTFPWGTFVVNVSGCFAIGLLVTLADEHGWLGPSSRLFLVAGLLGGFTTFSTFGLETFELLREQHTTAALLNAGASVVTGLLGVVAGVALGRNLG